MGDGGLGVGPGVGSNGTNSVSTLRMCSEALKLARFGKTELSHPTPARDDSCPLIH
jgi:hypothetical protein